MASQDLWSEVGIRADDASRFDRLLVRISKDSSGAKINKLNGLARHHDAVVELQITMRQAHAVKVIDARDDLLEDAVNFRSAHLAGHDDRKEVVLGVLHDFVIVAMVFNDIKSLDDIWVCQSQSARQTLIITRHAHDARSNQCRTLQ